MERRFLSTPILAFVVMKRMFHGTLSLQQMDNLASLVLISRVTFSCFDHFTELSVVNANICERDVTSSINLGCDISVVSTRNMYKRDSLLSSFAWARGYRN